MGQRCGEAGSGTIAFADGLCASSGRSYAVKAESDRREKDGTPGKDKVEDGEFTRGAAEMLPWIPGDALPLTIP